MSATSYPAAVSAATGPARRALVINRVDAQRLDDCVLQRLAGRVDAREARAEIDEDGPGEPTRIPN